MSLGRFGRTGLPGTAAASTIRMLEAFSSWATSVCLCRAIRLLSTSLLASSSRFRLSYCTPRRDSSRASRLAISRASATPCSWATAAR